ncbi:DUF2637 domain-containing protein [Streptomyces sp. NPDC091377]|uniref:DUF2637 domain-containing protein n=1 Tax=Streptomyces sp. NPDC091377 TaxID=3365995 RepID=UPI00382FEB6A
MAAPLELTRTHRVLIGLVVFGAVIIAGIGFAGSYAAVRELALQKGFGNFSYVFPIGIDAGICVLLALDLLLTWIRIPFPLLRQTAWLLTAATIAFNGAAAWPDPLGVGMHGVIPVLFVVSVEAARHAIGRIADITADKHMEGVRLTRWMLSPVPTFLLWRRMKLWELRSYEQVIKLEQERLVYQARLRSRYGRGWRRKAPVESLMPLRLAKYGVPLAETAPAGLAAAGIEPALIPPPPATPELESPHPTHPAQTHTAQAETGRAQITQTPAVHHAQAPAQAQAHAQAQAQGEPPLPAPRLPQQTGGDVPSQWFNTPQQKQYQGGYDPGYEPPTFVPEQEHQSWYDEQSERIQAPLPVPHPRSPEPAAAPETKPELTPEMAPATAPESVEEYAEETPDPQMQVPNGAGGLRPLGDGVPEAAPPTADELYEVFKYSIDGEGIPTPGTFAANVEATYSIRLQSRELNQYMDDFATRLNGELMEDHIA